MLLVVGCSDASSEATITPTTPETNPSTTSGDPGTTEADTSEVGTLLVIGDWGDGSDSQHAVAKQVLEYTESSSVDALLTAGDNFYSDDADDLMDPYDWVEEMSIPWWVTWGNHDVESEDRIAAVNDVFGSPPRWTVHRWGAIDIMILDSNQVTNLSQAGFFLSEMSSSDRPTIVVLHHPPYSCSHHGSTTEIVNAWVSILDDDVFLVLSGHDHSYQRFENDGITYVVTGGGGRSIRPLTECPANHPARLAGAELNHFLSLTQTETSIQMTAVDLDGNLIESVTLDLP